MKSKTLRLTQSAIIAALYLTLTCVSMFFGLDKSFIQLRLAEMLTVLPIFTPAAIPGLFVGCLLANLLTGCLLWDVVFGSLATLLGAIGTYLLRRHPILALFPPILANMLIIPPVLRFVYAAPGSIPLFMLTVGIGEVLSCGVLGVLLWLALRKHADRLFSTKLQRK